MNLFLFSILLLAGFFGIEEGVYAAESPIVITEILVETANDKRKEFIELYNNTDKDIDLTKHQLKKKTNSGSTEYFLVSMSNFAGTISAHGYFLITPPSYKDLFDADLIYSGSSSSYSIASENAILLYDSTNTLLASLSYGNAIADYSYSFNGAEWLWTPILTPKKENQFPEETPSNPEPPIEEPVCAGKNSDIKLTEIYPYTINTSDEFVEIQNIGENCVDISDWTIKDNANHKYAVPEKTILNATEYFYIQKNLYLNNDTDIAYLLDKNDSTVDMQEYNGALKNYSYSFDGEKWQWASFPTPGAENKFDEVEQLADNANKNTASSYDIYLNEILPNPKGNEKENEYIELYNNEPADVDISGWILKDASNTKYVFPQNSVIGAGKYLLLQRTSFKFALNNSGNETVFLFDSFEHEISKAAYSGSAKENVSYNFDGTNWRWSKFLTPGAENIFNNLPTVSAKKKNKIYAGVYAEFSAKGKDADKDKLKYVWDFGDGHKSYKKETRHKYEKVGKYEVMLKVSDGSEDKIETFKVEVKKFPKDKIEITSVSPNPEGKDSEAEYILVKNNSKKKINLKDWSVATGSKKLYNHPINKDMVIKPGETKKIARNVSNFALNNKKAKIELRYPDGKVAAKIKYEKDGSAVAEGELYAKVDKKWSWIAAKPAAIKNSITSTSTVLQENSALASAAPQTIPLPPALKISEAAIKNDLGKISTIKDARENKLLSIAASELPAPQNISSSSREKINFLLGIQTVRAEGDAYHFTDSSYQAPDHYAVKFFKDLLTSTNSLLNKFFILFN